MSSDEETAEFEASIALAVREHRFKPSRNRINSDDGEDSSVEVSNNSESPAPVPTEKGLEAVTDNGQNYRREHIDPDNAEAFSSNQSAKNSRGNKSETKSSATRTSKMGQRDVSKNPTKLCRKPTGLQIQEDVHSQKSVKHDGGIIEQEPSQSGSKAPVCGKNGRGMLSDNRTKPKQSESTTADSGKTKSKAGGISPQTPGKCLPDESPTGNNLKPIFHERKSATMQNKIDFNLHSKDNVQVVHEERYDNGSLLSDEMSLSTTPSDNQIKKILRLKNSSPKPEDVNQETWMSFIFRDPIIKIGAVYQANDANDELSMAQNQKPAAKGLCMPLEPTESSSTKPSTTGQRSDPVLPPKSLNPPSGIQPLTVSSKRGTLLSPTDPSCSDNFDSSLPSASGTLYVAQPAEPNQTRPHSCTPLQTTESENDEQPHLSLLPESLPSTSRNSTFATPSSQWGTLLSPIKPSGSDIFGSSLPSSNGTLHSAQPAQGTANYPDSFRTSVSSVPTDTLTPLPDKESSIVPHSQILLIPKSFDPPLPLNTDNGAQSHLLQRNSPSELTLTPPLSIEPPQVGSQTPEMPSHLPASSKPRVDAITTGGDATLKLPQDQSKIKKDPKMSSQPGQNNSERIPASPLLTATLPFTVKYKNVSSIESLWDNIWQAVYMSY